VDAFTFDDWIAERYELLWPELFTPEAIEPAVDFLARVAQGGPALELGIGTGRLALPLARTGIRVAGIDRSAAMIQQLRTQPGGDSIDAAVGDFATTRVDGDFALVYLVRNTITNLTTQDEQVRCFANAATHLRAGGSFVIENYVPELQRLPPSVTRHVFTATEDHVAFEEYDVAAQIAVSHHYWTVEGQLTRWSSTHRYAWPSELDLMARLAGMRLVERWHDWRRTPFTSESRQHVSLWQKPS